MKRHVLAAILLVLPLKSQSIPPGPSQDLPEGQTWVYSPRAKAWVEASEKLDNSAMTLVETNATPAVSTLLKLSTLKPGDILEFDAIVYVDFSTSRPDLKDIQIALDLPNCVTLAQPIVEKGIIVESSAFSGKDHTVTFRAQKVYHVKLYIMSSGYAHITAWANLYKDDELVGYKRSVFEFQIKGSAK